MKDVYKVTLLFVAFILIVVVSSLIFSKNFGIFISSIIILISFLTFKETKYVAVTLLIPIILSGIQIYEDWADKPSLEIAMHSLKERGIFKLNTLIEYDEVTITPVSFQDNNLLFMTTPVKGKNPDNKIQIINPRQGDTCPDCTWYQFTIKKEKGKLNFPIFLNFDSSEKIELANRDPRVEFECGEGIYSEGICSLTIKRISDELKLLFYSKSPDLVFSVDSDTVGYSEIIQRSDVFFLDEGDIFDVQVACGDPKEGLEELTLPLKCQNECIAYKLEGDHFVEDTGCKIW